MMMMMMMMMMMTMVLIDMPACMCVCARGAAPSAVFDAKAKPKCAHKFAERPSLSHPGGACTALSPPRNLHNEPSY
eukprot:2122049-Amphidinium_carterae.1